jgi:hypothetical protein
MALHTDTKIFKATYDLTLLVAKLVANMPRNFKADFGADLRHDCMGLVRRVYQANTATEKTGPLKQMREEVSAVELSLRLAMDLRLISKGQYAEAIEITNSIGRQATGWLQHSEKALVPASPRWRGQCVI